MLSLHSSKDSFCVNKCHQSLPFFPAADKSSPSATRQSHLMPKRNGSPDSLNDFYPESSARTDADNKKSKQSDLPPSLGIAALMRNQPMIYSLQSSTDAQCKAPLHGLCTLPVDSLIYSDGK